MKKLFLILSLTIFGIADAFASTFYWVGGNGNWSTFATHWATTSGGNIFYTQVPSSLDDVIFDANSFSATGQTVTVDQTIAYCKNMSWVGVTNNPTFSCLATTTKIKIHGSLALSQNMNAAFDGIISFEALTLGNSIAFNNQTLLCQIEFNGFGAEWSLLDSLTTTEAVVLSFGTLRTNSNNLTCGNFANQYYNTPCSLFLGTSVITITDGGWAMVDSVMSLDADSAHIIFKNAGIFISDRGSNLSIYDKIDFFAPTTMVLPQLIRARNTRINKATFWGNASVPGIETPSEKLTIDSVFSNGPPGFKISNSFEIFIDYIYCAGNFYMQNTYSDTINTLIVGGNGSIGQINTMNSGVGVFGSAFFNGDLTIYYNTVNPNSNKFSKCTIMGDGNILSNANYFDTLKLSVGRTYTFGSNKTQYINNWFDCFGNPGFPIQLIADTFGQQATINIGQNMFCSDYLYMRDMNGTGSSNLFAGANSNNVFNNSGWTFSNCAIGINELSDFTFNIYPNPFSSSTTLQTTTSFKNATLTVDNCFGQQVKQFVISRNEFGTGSNSDLPTGQTGSFVIHRDNLPSGLYFLRLTQDNKIITTDKIVITDN